MRKFVLDSCSGFCLRKVKFRLHLYSLCAGKRSPTERGLTILLCVEKREEAICEAYPAWQSSEENEEKGAQAIASETPEGAC